MPPNPGFDFPNVPHAEAADGAGTPANPFIEQIETVAGLGVGADYSVNPVGADALIAAATWTVVATIPVATAPRKGLLIQNQSATIVYVVVDDGVGGAATTFVLGAAGAGQQGASLGLADIPHGGQIRIAVATSAVAGNPQIGVRAW